MMKMNKYASKENSIMVATGVAKVIKITKSTTLFK